jgi:hypothetical protein
MPSSAYNALMAANFLQPPGIPVPINNQLAELIGVERLRQPILPPSAWPLSAALLYDDWPISLMGLAPLVLVSANPLSSSNPKHLDSFLLSRKQMKAP